MQLNSLVGKKIYQKQGFLQDGRRVSLTGVEVFGNFIVQVKTESKEGYNALQLGIGIKKKAGKRQTGHSKKAGLEKTPRFFKEIRADDLEGAVLGSELNVSQIFQPGNIVDVTGISKGKGFAGGVKRWGFHGGPKTHGQSDRHRAPGSIGQGTTPGRVYRGKKMAGRMGSDTVTLKNLEIIEVTSDGVLLIKGLVPGSINSIVVVKKVGENKKFVPLYSESKDDGNGSSSVSEDAQQVPNTQDSDSASLSESQLPISGEDREAGEELPLDSSEDVQAPIAEKSTVSEPVETPVEEAVEADKVQSEEVNIDEVQPEKVKEKPQENKEEVHPSPEATEDK